MKGTKSMSVRLISTVVNGEWFAVIQYLEKTEFHGASEYFEVRKTTPWLFLGDKRQTEIITVTSHKETAMAVYREVVAIAKDST